MTLTELNITLEPFLDPVNTVNHIACYFTNPVESQKISISNILQERDQFFSHSLDLLALIGTDGYFKRVNPTFKNSLGYSKEELLSDPISFFLHPEDIEKTQQGIQVLLGGLSKLGTVNRYRCKDNSYKWFSWNTSVLGDQLFTVGRDITEQLKIEQKIKELNQELERKNENLEILILKRIEELRKSEAQVIQLQKMDAVGRLAGGIAHDFNNMLSAISIYCETLQEEFNNPEAILENISELKKVIVRASALTRQLLTFSRKQIVQHQAIQLNSLITHLQSMLERIIGEKITIITQFSDDLSLIKVDPGHIDQVILNLVVNAKDAMPNGGEITIETSNTFLDKNFISAHLPVSPGNYVLLSVSDNGEGMDAETKDKIFEPFFTTKAAGKGTGLGLATTYGIVKQCEGTIYVDSELGKGTVFNIYFPVADDSIEQSQNKKVEISIEATETVTILLAEDDKILREGFTKVLTKNGYQVLAASNGKEALEICQAHVGPIHLLLTDMVIPEISGTELAQRSTDLRRELQVLYMSGYTSESLENSTNTISGELQFIQKPFSTSELLTKLQEVLKSK